MGTGSYTDYILGLQYVTWNGTRGYPTTANPSRGSGHQLYFPVAVTFGGKPNSDLAYWLQIRNGFVDSRQTTPGQSGSYSGWLDTLVTGTIAFTENPSLVPFVSIGLNLPTGETRLLNGNSFARMDQDIVPVPTFGEGFNVQTVMGVGMELWPRTALTVGVGYTNRGSYTRDDPAAPPVGLLNVSPSDETKVAATLTSEWNPLRYWLNISYAWDSAHTLAPPGAPALSVDPGDRLTLAAGAVYTWADPRWVTGAELSWSHLKPNSAVMGGVALANGSVNANGDVFVVGVQHAYRTRRWAAALRGLYFDRSANEYSIATLNFVPAKTKWEIGAALAITPENWPRLQFAVTRIWTREEAAPGSGLPAVRQDAWQFLLGANLAVASLPAAAGVTR